MKEQHTDRKRVWTEKSDNLTSEWKRLAKMTPQEYYAEFKAKQVIFFWNFRNHFVNLKFYRNKLDSNAQKKKKRKSKKKPKRQKKRQKKQKKVFCGLLKKSKMF